MQDVRLPDGTWVTNPMFMGIGDTLVSRCPDDTCVWEDYGPPSPPGDLPVQLQAQQCVRCRWTRVKYLGNPHPEIK